MSDLLRALPKIKEQDGLTETRRRPPPHVLTNPSEDDASSSSGSSASTADSIDTLRPSSPGRTSKTAQIVPWSNYFAQELYITSITPDQHATYHVYLTPPRNPSKGPLFICHHGAGASGMSFARFAGFLKHIMPEAGVLSLEAREHGSHVVKLPTSSNDLTDLTTTPTEILDFSIETLATDTLSMIHGTMQKCGWPHLPPCVLIGHSLGGAIVTHIAASGALSPHLVGFQVLDVVEGAAIEALAHMRTYLAARPASFASVQAAVEWHVRSRTVRDVESASASVPSLLVRCDGDGLDDGEEGAKEGEGRWRWKTDLRRTEAWWQDWFTGMSAKFLRGKAAKSLVLAGTDRLDRELMVGQMQGKFQLTVIPEAGHFVHEDVPERMAQLSAEFFRRNDRSAMVLPPKVADLIAQGKKV